VPQCPIAGDATAPGAKLTSYITGITFMFTKFLLLEAYHITLSLQFASFFTSLMRRWYGTFTLIIVKL